MGDYFNPDTYSGIRFDDPFFSVKWPHKPVYISSRDLNSQTSLMINMKVLITGGSGF